MRKTNIANIIKNYIKILHLERYIIPTRDSTRVMSYEKEKDTQARSLEYRGKSSPAQKR